MPWAVFIQNKGANRATDKPCLDPLDLGVGDEPFPTEMLRRGRVGLFPTHAAALDEIQRTIESAHDAGHLWTKDFEFVVLECVDRSNPEAQ